ncbi:sugar 3,4-ketoisomerase [Hymenobacter ruricola]|uniref:FdtA/QdtA family cupin domain-containing protein n=1 Tax=Hymenobacter ruricola TaxID=2791023 RepID=A0ABS0I654_9BACT|nr:FdtA/QdtA family cupin domain-containing protein [Hymenobacter ruricola]MBF9222163.1 FdtA/QdtA family cupin domain-containing protein [Hymenobacter ruricola]
MSVPRLIEFSKIGSPALGYITVGENSTLPFIVQRVYWTYFTPDSVIRGHHAHHDLEQLIFATSGRIEFVLEGLDGKSETFVLDSPNLGLYIPKLYWRTIKFSHNAVLMCLASMEYSEDDYIREYNHFKALAATTNA